MNTIENPNLNKTICKSINDSKIIKKLLFVLSGMRFGLMQVKVALVRILSTYDVSLSKTMKLPIKLNPKTVPANPDGGMFLLVTKRYH